jgi:hypothetical protein
MSHVSSAALPMASSVRAERSLSAIRRVDRRLNFIRTLCHLRPSAEVWAKVCEGFETWSSRDAGFEFWVSMASSNLSDGPTRSAPSHPAGFGPCSAATLAPHGF